MAITAVGSATSSGSSTNINITHGLTILSGDVVLAFTAVNGTQSGAETDNNGANAFTFSYETANTALDGADGREGIWAKVAGASEPANYSFTATDSNTWTIIIRVFRGVDATIFDVTPSASTDTRSSANGTTATAPAMTVLTVGAWGVCWFYTDGAITYSGYTNSYITEVETGASNPSQSTVVREFSSTGSSGTTAATLSGSNDWVAHQFALKPAATGRTTKNTRAWNLGVEVGMGWRMPID